MSWNPSDGNQLPKRGKEDFAHLQRVGKPHISLSIIHMPSLLGGVGGFPSWLDHKEYIGGGCIQGERCELPKLLLGIIEIRPPSSSY